MALIKFAPFGATIHPSFWQQLSSFKIDRLQLSEEPVDVRGGYSTGKSILDRQTGQEVHLGCSINVDGASFLGEKSSETSGRATVDAAVPPSTTYVAAIAGRLKNFNTIEDFKNADKQAAFDEALQDLWHSIIHAEDPTEKLSSFLVLTFADLKKYRFYYWFAFPALTAKPSWELAASGSLEDGERAWKPVSTALGGKAAENLSAQLARRHEAGGRCDFFLVKQTATTVEVGDVKQFKAFFADVAEEDRIVGFLDPSSNADAPGWPLRNLLAMLHARYGVTKVKVVRWKDPISATGATDTDNVFDSDFDSEAAPNARLSLMGDICLPSDRPADSSASKVVLGDGRMLALACQPNRLDTPAGVGWERNAQGKLAPKVADLGPLMDPARLADQAVDLNLKLMRWRIMPDIQLGKIQQTKCLLLGAGTLGCYVARTLLGWGVRHITFVDSSRVSFSNPVRQPLFEFEDCLEGGKPKAQCAADRLRKVYPGVNVSGHLLSIPMPGHPIPASSSAQVERDVAQLESLVASHDVVYLLMDSRESRWLPSVLGAAKGKLVINAALGFDTYLVMRHGAPPSSTATAADEQTKAPSHRRLGCYFCNDIVAPSDSLTDRTLDQMCTVTRPGLAAIAGSTAVELMVSVVQHPQGVSAPAAVTGSDNTDASTVLGVVPHQLRGFLARFSNLMVVGQAYDRCTGCSAKVVEEWEKEGWGMVEKACGEEGYLERLTGLDEMYKEAEEMQAVLDWESEGEDGSEGDEL